MTESHPFRFEKAPKKKGICPQCGHSNKFRYCEDLTGNRLEDFGRCERTNSCGYQIWPTGKAVPKTEGAYRPPPEPKQIFPSGKVLSRLQRTLTNQNSPFHRYAASLGVSLEHLGRWRVGTESQSGKTYTVFVHETTGGQVVNAKWVQYGADGNRIKSTDDTGMDSFSLKQPTDRTGGLELKRYELCLYGEHLLDPAKKRPVFLIESEKSAVIAAWFYREYDFVAVGSANGLTDKKISALTGRRCYWLSDADGNEIKLDPKTKKEKLSEGGRKNSSIRKLQAYEIRHAVLDLFPERKDGYDIADAIHDGLMPDLLDAHQRQLVKVQADVPSEDQIDPRTGSPDAHEDMSEEGTDLARENQVGLPEEVWSDEQHRMHFKKYGFIESKNAYYFGTKRGTKGTEQADDTWVFKAVSNFVIQPLLLIESKSDPKRIYQITNSYNITKVIELDAKQFSNPAGFSEVVMSRGNFIFYGAKSHFIRITMKLFEESKEAQEVKTLGYHPDGFYAFANGIQNTQWVPLDESGYGTVQHNDKLYFLPALSKIYVSDDQEYPTQKLFIYKKGDITFKDYAEKFCDIYQLNGNGRIGLLFYISCLFRDIIYGHFRFFPHLYLFGVPQSGKSSLAISAMHLFGEGRLPFMLNTGTPVGFYKHFAEFRNAVVWFDEYKNNIDSVRIQSLKTAYDGAGHTKSENSRDNRNRSIPVYSGCIVSGQELPTADVALFTRCILLEFPKTVFTLEEKDLKTNFRAQVELLGVSHLTAHIVTLRDVFEERFMKAFNVEFALIKTHFQKRGVDDRIVNNMSILLATYQSLKDRLEFPFNEDQLRSTAYAIMTSQNNLIAGSKETSTFWKMVMFMHRNRQISKGVDYQITLKAFVDIEVPGDRSSQRINLVDADNPVGKRVLFIRLQNMHTYYEKLCRETNTKGMDEGSLRYYLVTQKGFIGRFRGVKFGKNSTTGLCFDYDYLVDTIEDFSLDDFMNGGDQDDDIKYAEATMAGSSKDKGEKITLDAGFNAIRIEAGEEGF